MASLFRKTPKISIAPTLSKRNFHTGQCGVLWSTCAYSIGVFSFRVVFWSVGIRPPGVVRRCSNACLPVPTPDQLNQKLRLGVRNLGGSQTPVDIPGGSVRETVLCDSWRLTYAHGFPCASPTRERSDPSPESITIKSLQAVKSLLNSTGNSFLAWMSPSANGVSVYSGMFLAVSIRCEPAEWAGYLLILPPHPLAWPLSVGLLQSNRLLILIKPKQDF